MGAPPRRGPIGTRRPPLAPPWPIYPDTIFSGYGVFASIRGAGRGDIDCDGQIDGSKKTTFSFFFLEKGKHFLDSDSKVVFRIRSQNLHAICFEHIIDWLFEPSADWDPSPYA